MSEPGKPSNTFYDIWRDADRFRKLEAAHKDPGGRFVMCEARYAQEWTPVELPLADIADALPDVNAGFNCPQSTQCRPKLTSPAQRLRVY